MTVVEEEAEFGTGSEVYSLPLLRVQRAECERKRKHSRGGVVQEMVREVEGEEVGVETVTVVTASGVSGATRTK